MGVGADGAMGGCIQKGMENGNESISKGIEAYYRSRRGCRIVWLHRARVRVGRDRQRNLKRRQPCRRRRRPERGCARWWLGRERRGGRRSG